MPKETCLKPIGELAQAIEATSAGGFLLFMIAQDRATRKKEKQSILMNDIQIGFND